MRPELAGGYGSLAHAHGAELMFDSFRRWPLVPSSQLVRLRSALLQCVELASPDNGRDLSESAGKLLRLVTDELDRRNGHSWARSPAGRVSAGAAAPSRIDGRDGGFAPLEPVHDGGQFGHGLGVPAPGPRHGLRPGPAGQELSLPG